MRFACTECRKKFRSEGAMRMHMSDKHHHVIHAVTPYRHPRVWPAAFLASLIGTMVGVILWQATQFAMDITDVQPAATATKALESAKARWSR
jgi:hypothetical protein